MFGRQREEETFMEKMMKSVVKNLIYLLLFVVLFGLVLMPMLKDKLGGYITPKSQSEVVVIEPKIEATYTEGVGYSCAVVGKAQNKGEAKAEKVTIHFDLYDEAGQNLGTAIAVVDTINGLETIDFTANSLSIYEKKPVDFEMTKVLIMK